MESWNEERSSSSTTNPTSPTSSSSISRVRATGCCRRRPARVASKRSAPTGRASSCSTSGSPTSTASRSCKRLRQTSQIPVIFLTARDGEVDRVLGLELGGDDYLTKPFSPAELVARVKAVLRRVDGGPAPEVVQAGDTTIDCGRREVRVRRGPGRVHHQGVRPAPLPGGASGPRALPPADPRRRVGLRLVRRRPHRRRAHRAGAQEARRRGHDHHGAGCRVPPGVVEVRQRHDVTRRTRRLRTRLLVAMIAIALGTLVVTAAVTAGLAASHRDRRGAQHARRPHAHRRRRAQPAHRAAAGGAHGRQHRPPGGARSGGSARSCRPP